MVFNALISAGYSTVVEAWALAVFCTKFFLLGTVAYSYYRDTDLLESLLDASEYYVTGLVVAGLIFMVAEVEAPSGGIISEAVTLIYFFILFWNY